MSVQELHEIRVLAGLALAATTDQVLVSQRQYVDVLLDLRSVAVSSVLRETIEERLRDVRFVTMVDAIEVHTDLEAIVAISEIEDELEMAWADVAMTCECDDCKNAIDAHEARCLAPG
jgi:hypothetical protein